MKGHSYQIPPILYKYMRLEDAKTEKRAREILLEDKLFFPSPKTFNDPFDCRVITKVGGKKWRKACAKRAFKSEPRERRRALQAHWVKESNRREFEQLVDEGRLRVQKAVDSLGVLCLSAVPPGRFPSGQGGAYVDPSILMWSHYTASHSGFCLGFDTSDYFRHAKRVDYTRTRPALRLIYGDKAADEDWMTTITTKASCWSYEEEWRIHKNTHGLWEFPPEQLRQVILGCKIRQKHEEMIQEWLKSRKSTPELFKAEFLEEGFGLQVVRFGDR